MAHSLTALKRIRQNETRAAANRWRLRTMRDAIKNFDEQIVHGDVAKATEAFMTCQKVIDKTAQNGVIHKNQASRRKSRLSAKLLAKKKAKA